MIPTDDLMNELDVDGDRLHTDTQNKQQEVSSNIFMPDTTNINIDIRSRNASNVTVRSRTMRKQSKSARQLPDIDTNELNTDIFQVAAVEPLYPSETANNNQTRDGAGFEHTALSNESNLNSYSHTHLECNSQSDVTNGDHSSTILSNEDDHNDTISDINDYNVQSGDIINGGNVEHGSQVTSESNQQYNTDTRQSDIFNEEANGNQNHQLGTENGTSYHSYAINCDQGDITSITSDHTNNSTHHSIMTKSSSGSALSSHNGTTNHQGHSPSKPFTSKDKNPEERLRLIREKQEQELERRKRELEENLKRKQEFWFKQQREKQKRLEESKLRENEKHLACEERRKKREEIERIRLNELMKREQERAKTIHKSNTMRENSNAVNSGNDCNGSDEDTQTANTNINKSQSAYNISQNKRNISGEGNSSQQSQQSSGLSKRLTNSTMRLSHSKESPNSKSSAMTESNDESLLLKSKRSRTVPSTPMHNGDTTSNANHSSKKSTNEFTHETTSNFRNQLSKIMSHKAAAASTHQQQSPNESLNTSSALNKSLYWEGPPAHFMLPTHAIHCRLSRSVERCPRACKALVDNVAEETKYSKPNLQTIAERNKPLPEHLQQTINRLSVPKKLNLSTEDTMNTTAASPTHQHTSHRSTTPHKDATTTETATSSSNSLSMSHKKSAQHQRSPQLPTSSSKKNLKSASEIKPSTTAKRSLPKSTSGTVSTDIANKKIDALKSLGSKQKRSGMATSASNGSIMSLNSTLAQSKKSNSNSTLSLQAKTREEVVPAKKQTSKPKSKTTALKKQTLPTKASPVTPTVAEKQVEPTVPIISESPKKETNESETIVGDIQNLVITSNSEPMEAEAPCPVEVKEEFSREVESKEEAALVPEAVEPMEEAVVEVPEVEEASEETKETKQEIVEENKEELKQEPMEETEEEFKQEELLEEAKVDASEEHVEVPVEESKDESKETAVEDVKVIEPVAETMVEPEAETVKEEKVEQTDTAVESIKEEPVVEEGNNDSAANVVETLSEPVVEEPVVVEAAPVVVEKPAEPEQVTAPTTGGSAGYTDEDIAREKLEEKRREVRERIAREEELARQEEERRLREEQEQERLAEEEFLRLNELARKQEEERLRLALELKEKLEQEQREKEEAERRQKEENERKAREEAERIERERLEKIKKEEDERLERRKRIDLIMKRVQVNKEDNTSSSQTNLSMNPANGTSQSNLLMSGSATQNGSNSDLSALKSMTSSYTAIRADSTDNGNALSGASMTQSMINPSESDQPRFKTPLLQTILSKTRINNIYNKYATNDGNTANNQTNESGNKSDCVETTRIASATEEEKKSTDDVKDTADSYEHELQLTEVNVEVENSSSASSSPSSPGSITSSTSSRSSQQASPPVQNTPPNQPPAPSHTQISA